MSRLTPPLLHHQEDAPPAPKEPPHGFRIVADPPSAEALIFSKAASPAADALVGCSVLFNWPAVGWCLGRITSRNSDARKSVKMDDGVAVKKNFNIYYEIDGEEACTALRLEEYNGDDECSWVLLEAEPSDGEAEPSDGEAAGPSGQVAGAAEGC